MYGLLVYGFYGLWIKTDNTAYQALVLVWLGCGNNVKAKFEQVVEENKTKTLKKEISELNKQIKTLNLDLKSALKDKKDINNDFEKKLRILEDKNKNLVHFKMSKEGEEKGLKVKLKNANKRLKAVTEN